MTFETTHAKHDPAHCLCPGLFRSFVKGQRKKTPLNVEYSYGNEKIEIKGPELLGAFELRVMQGLIAMSGPRGVILELDNPKTPAGEELARRLEPRWKSIDEDALVVRGSYYQLGREIGLHNPEGGYQARLIREAVERLWFVSMIVESGGVRRGHRILSDYESTTASGGKLFVALNPRIASAVLGSSPKHTQICMHEVRSLKADPARLIHQRLCGFIDIGKAHRTPIALATLAGYVWHDSHVEEGTAAYRQRMTTVRKALTELVSLGWRINEVTKGKYTIGRPVISEK